MKVADYIANQFFNAGVRYVFGIPGGPSIPWMEAFRDAGIEFILTSHEAAAGIMADVTARLTGIPGVCHATFGPGATNISTGAGSALLDRSSVIVLTSEMSDDMAGRTAQMNIDHQKLFGPVTKATFRLNASNCGEVLEKAFRICMEEYPGPVHIGMPSGIEGCETTDLPVRLAGKYIEKHGNETERITELLRESRRPLLAVGLTSKRLNISRELKLFLDKNDIPVVITPMAKGIIPDDHPSYAGVLFHAMSDYLEELYGKCDLVIGLGYDPVEYNYESWMPDVPLIHFDTRKVDMPAGKSVFQYAGEPGEWFRLLESLNISGILSEKTLIKGIRNEMLSVFDGFTGHFGPAAAIKILREELPDDSILTADVGSHLHLLGQFWDIHEKGRFIITNGWSGMGFGIPAAIASTINCPGSTVVCITGDGGFLMTAGEMMTARRYNLPVIVIVFSDGELNLIRLKQSWKDFSSYGTMLYRDDLFGSDVFLGIRVITARTSDGLRKSVNSALAMNEPVIINAVIDPEDYKWMIVKPVTGDRLPVYIPKSSFSTE
jgi:acetolactate synthase-1/2/3 large subunit